MAGEGTRADWTEERVIRELRRLREELGRSPVVRDDRALAMAARRLFGSWNEAKEAAGLKTHSYPTGEKPLARKLSRLLRDRGVVTRGEAEEELDCSGASISNLLRTEDFGGIELDTGRSAGSIKYRSSKLLRSDRPHQLIYRDPIELGRYMEGIFRFELSPRIERGKKMAITRFLRKKVPEEAFDYLHSLYTKSGG